jgi:acetolactate synthase-1/2/3 large subunit
MGYGSPAVFPDARFVRIANNVGEFIDNRRGTPEILATPKMALEAILAEARGRTPATDRAWTGGLRRKHEERSAPK